jgi:hypothetical protein
MQRQRQHHCHPSEQVWTMQMRAAQPKPETQAVWLLLLRKAASARWHSQHVPPVRAMPAGSLHRHRQAKAIVLVAYS